MRNGFLDNLPDLGLERRAKKKRKVEPLNLENAVVRYVRPRCPRCKSPKVPVYDSNHLPIRYHKCSKCGLRFKSIEQKG